MRNTVVGLEFDSSNLFLEETLIPPHPPNYTCDISVDKEIPN